MSLVAAEDKYCFIAYRFGKCVHAKHTENELRRMAKMNMSSFSSRIF